MENTANLELPYIMPSQAQKHVTHNEALAIIDAVVQLSVHDRDLDAPPGDPAEGDRYIVAADATGAWEGWDGEIALWADGGWRRIAPRFGWLAWVEDEGVIVRRAGAGWTVLGDAIGTPQELAMIGIGTTADGENPFAAKLNKALWTARYDGEGGDGDLRYTLNKEEPAGVLSLLMQSDWSGRAEIGLVGDDDLTIKVSADGSSWKEAVRIDRDTGAASFPHTAMVTMVGTVSESGGEPTGAIIERGSNANGEYVKFADGTQVCTHAINLGGRAALGSGTLATPYRTGFHAWTFPAAFAAEPSLAGMALIDTATNAARGLSLSASIPSTSAVSEIMAGAQSSNNANQDVIASLAAVGRWF